MSDVWDVLCLKHGINFCGFQSKEAQDDNEQPDPSSHFIELSNGRYSPRVVFLDLDNEPIDNIRRGYLKRLFDDHWSFAHKHTSSYGNFARAYYGKDGEVLSRKALELWRYQHEQSERISSIFQINSLEGGTGSGIGSLFDEALHDIHITTKIATSCHQLYPSRHISDSCNSPLNVALGYYGMHPVMHLHVCYDNQCLFERCQTGFGAEIPTYASINSMIAPSVVEQFNICETNAVPFPQLNHLLPAHVNQRIVDTEAKAVAPMLKIQSLIYDIVKPSSQLCYAGHSLFHNRLFSANILVHGSNGHKGEVPIQAIRKMAQEYKLKFVDYCPGFLNSESCKSQYKYPARSKYESNKLCVSAYFNTTAIRDAFKTILNQFDLLCQYRCFFHWYTEENLDEQIFKDAREHIHQVYQTYTLAHMDADA